MQEFWNGGVFIFVLFIQDLCEKYCFEVILVIGENQGSVLDIEEDFL